MISDIYPYLNEKCAQILVSDKDSEVGNNRIVLLVKNFLMSNIGKIGLSNQRMDYNESNNETMVDGLYSQYESINPNIDSWLLRVEINCIVKWNSFYYHKPW